MDRKERILVVDDEPRLVRLVREVLQAMGYRVITAGDGKAALEMVAIERPDLVLLDVLLPHGMDGYEICRRLREFSAVPVIMLTAKAREEDKLKGFGMGADDYLTKPFSSRELLARVQAILRRSNAPEELKANAEFVCGQLSIHFAQHRVFVRGREVSMTATEYELLRQLALNANCLMMHEQLLTAVWGLEYRNDIDYLRAYIRYLRRKIEPDPSNPQYILTTPGVGYMLACPPRESQSS
jgi:two-component system KDP operon response regulator KdpE